MISPNKLGDIIIKTIIGHETPRLRIVNINSKHLCVRGDLSFRLGIDHWRGYVIIDSDRSEKPKNILHYFIHRYLNDQYVTFNNDQINDNVLEVFKKCIIEELIQIYNVKNLNEHLLFNISNDFVLINFNRSIVSCAMIKIAIEQDAQYGKIQKLKKYFKCIVDTNKESEITNLRLNLLKRVSINCLKSQSCDLHNKNDISNNYIFTVKSEGKVNNDCIRYLCGAVLNTSKRTERCWSQEMYLQRKIEKIKKLSEQKFIYNDTGKNPIESDIKKIAKASITYELLSVKHSSPVTIQKTNDVDQSIKEAAFILYNNVRITSILDKYSKFVLIKDLPEIIPIEKIESFHKITDEESWSLIYNYIIKYPDVLSDIVRIEPKLDINIQLLWSFVSNLCHDFSKYYRKNKILMAGATSNDQIINMTTERLYMLKALRIVLRNSLSLLEVEELQYM